MTLYSSRNKIPEIAVAEVMKQAGIEVILTDFPWGEWECMVNTTEHDKEVRNKTIEEERRRIYEEYQKAAKADSEASIHGDMFPKNVERFWQQMKGEEV